MHYQRVQLAVTLASMAAATDRLSFDDAEILRLESAAIAAG